MAFIELAKDPLVDGADHDGAAILRSLHDVEQFGPVFERHYEAIHRYVARRFGATVADDIAAAVFGEAFASRSRFETSCANARPWLYGITVNLLRRRARQDGAQWKAYAKHGRDPLAAHANPRIDEVAVAAALGALSADDRETVLLFAWADLTYDDIATALSIPVGTVRSRINRARTQLRISLKDFQ